MPAVAGLESQKDVTITNGLHLFRFCSGSLGSTPAAHWRRVGVWCVCVGRGGAGMGGAAARDCEAMWPSGHRHLLPPPPHMRPHRTNSKQPREDMAVWICGSRGSASDVACLRLHSGRSQAAGSWRPFAAEAVRVCRYGTSTVRTYVRTYVRTWITERQEQAVERWQVQVGGSVRIVRIIH